MALCHRTLRLLYSPQQPLFLHPEALLLHLFSIHLSFQLSVHGLLNALRLHSFDHILLELLLVLFLLLRAPKAFHILHQLFYLLLEVLTHRLLDYFKVAHTVGVITDQLQHGLLIWLLFVGFLCLG